MRTRALAAVAVFIAIAAVLVAARSSGELHPPFPRAQAERAVLNDATARPFLRDQGWTDVKTQPLDKTHWRVTFFKHGYAVLDASIGPRGHVDAIQNHPPGVHAAGSSIAWNRPLLFGMALLFLLATAVTPILRARNLDVVVLTGGMLAVLLLYDARFVAGDAYGGAALLAYFVARCAWVGLRHSPDRHESTSLYSVLGRSLEPAARVRVAVMVGIAVVLASAIITYSSSGISDVGFAGLAGATAIQRGHVPYGHVTHEIVHGDTYPPFTYLLYLPFSLASPVDDSFDNLQGALDLNVLALLAAAACAFVVGARRLADRPDTLAGSALAIAWLCCPAVLLSASGGGNDVPTAALVMAALAVANRPVVASGLLGLATAAKLGPLGGLGVWLAGMRGRSLSAALALSLAIGIAMLVLLVALGGGAAIGDMVNALAFQFRRGSFHSVWTQLDAGAGQAIFQAAVLTFGIVAVVHLARRRERPGLQQMCALGAAVILGLQLAANYWTYAYFTWALPFLLVALFPPRPRRSPPLAPVAPRTAVGRAEQPAHQGRT